MAVWHRFTYGTWNIQTLYGACNFCRKFRQSHYSVNLFFLHLPYFLVLDSCPSAGVTHSPSHVKATYNLSKTHISSANFFCSGDLQRVWRISCKLKNIYTFQRQCDTRYCKFGNFCENFILANSIKRHICDIKIRDWHDLPSSVNDRVISPFCEDFIFTKLRICRVSRK